MNKLAKSNNKEDSQATGECSSPISFNSMSTHRLSIKIPHVFMMYSNNCMNVWNIRKLSIIENRVYYILDQLVCRCLFLRYIQNPLLLKGKKFDVRSFLLIAGTSPVHGLLSPRICVANVQLVWPQVKWSLYSLDQSGTAKIVRHE